MSKEHDLATLWQKTSQRRLQRAWNHVETTRVPHAGNAVIGTVAVFVGTNLKMQPVRALPELIRMVIWMGEALLVLKSLTLVRRPVGKLQALQAPVMTTGVARGIPGTSNHSGLWQCKRKSMTQQH